METTKENELCECGHKRSLHKKNCAGVIVCNHCIIKKHGTDECYCGEFIMGKKLK